MIHEPIKGGGGRKKRLLDCWWMDGLEEKVCMLSQLNAVHIWPPPLNLAVCVCLLKHYNLQKFECHLSRSLLSLFSASWLAKWDSLASSSSFSLLPPLPNPPRKLPVKLNRRWSCCCCALFCPCSQISYISQIFFSSRITKILVLYYEKPLIMSSYLNLFL